MVTMSHVTLPWTNSAAWKDISADVVAAIELDYYVHESRKDMQPW